MKTQTQIKRLVYLSKMLNKYSHCWNENPSQRMYDWVDEYEEVRTTKPNVWEEYCKMTGFSIGHNAYDCLA